MKGFHYIISALLLVASCSCGGSSDSSDQPQAVTISITPGTYSAEYEKEEVTFTVECSGEWSVYSESSWITTSKARDAKSFTATIAANTTYDSRSGYAVVKSGVTTKKVEVTQAGTPLPEVDDSITVPAGHKLVWHDEFNEGTEPSSDWYYETGGGGWGNNEQQTYVKCYAPSGEQLATVADGKLTIKLAKIDGTVYSIRMNTNQSWTYGYFEARLKLPKGKGTWPAFWMMPKNYTSWPDDGEIDIMEEVGYNPNYVSSSIHCKAYYHSINTQKTAERYLAGAQDDFHVYACEWTKDYIRTFVDGEELFYFANDGKNDYTTWPFKNPFYLKLNLAWGGDWGGAMGLDESCLPATYEIDYVRIFQPE